MTGMRRRWGAVLVAAGSVAAGAAPAGAHAGAPSQPGTLPPLVEAAELRPPPGGQPGEVPVPHDINDDGDVVGESGGRAVLWRDGVPAVLPAGEGGERTVATQIDDRGRVYVDVVGAGAYRWDGGEVTPIEAGDAPVSPRRANDEGQVLVAGDGGGAVLGLWDDGDLAAIPAPDGQSPVDRGLSSAGHVALGTPGLLPVLYTTTVPWLWHEGRLTRLSLAPSFPTAVNRSGHVAGQSLGTGTGVLWRDGVEVPLGLLATDINDRGQIVGTRDVGDRHDSFLWQDGVLTRLGEAGPDAGTLWLRNGPAAVNEAGHAVGTRQEASGRVRYTLWTGGWAIDLGFAGMRQDAPPSRPIRPLAMNDRGQVVLTIRGEEGRPDRPVVWTITYPGDPVEPDGGCVLANNWAHVRDGRAASYAFHAWAAGSGTYLGLATDTTALRRSGPETWNLVDSC